MKKMNARVSGPGGSCDRSCEEEGREKWLLIEVFLSNVIQLHLASYVSF